MKHLRSFGEMAVVAIPEGKKMRSMLDNRGKTCMFVHDSFGCACDCIMVLVVLFMMMMVINNGGC